MNNKTNTYTQKLAQRESMAIFCLKAFAILSVIAAHTIILNDSTTINNLITSFWTVFGKDGVITFFITGGFLYYRKDNDNKSYWKKKFFRIILPWIICSFITYIVSIAGGNDLSFISYLKWIFGYGTWYYYIVMYMFFLFIFKYIYKHNWLLYLLMAINVVSLVLKITVFNNYWGELDYLNPLFWCGYFSLGVLIRRYRLDILLTKKAPFIIGFIVFILTTTIRCKTGTDTYFHPLSMINALSFYTSFYGISYFLANKKISKYIKPIGASTYCIYLLHMQIVQTTINLIPDGILKFIFAPFIGLTIMMVIIMVANRICKKLPFGDKLKMCFGL